MPPSSWREDIWVGTESTVKHSNGFIKQHSEADYDEHLPVLDKGLDELLA